MRHVEIMEEIEPVRRRSVRRLYTKLEVEE